MIRTMVVDDGLKVSCEASSGPEALAKLDSCDPRVVVLDQMMPGMNGIETAIRIKSERPAQLVILCTAFLDPTIAGALAAGVNAVLHKDDITTLPALIREVVTA